MALWIVVRLYMVVSDMKKYLINIAIFFAIVAIVDMAIWMGFHYLQANVAKGRIKVEYHACMESDEDVLILGSSRAAHHYVPQILSDSLGMKCFNAGQDGNGIILHYGRWKMISDRYSPKLIIYDITANFDIALNDNMTYVDRLKPFCYDSQVKKYIADIFPLEKYKLFSKMYRYNYKFLEVLSDCAANNVVDDGYAPLVGLIRQEIVDKENFEHKGITIDSVKLKYLEQLVKEAKEKNTRIIFVLSPSYRGVERDNVAIGSIKDIASRYNVRFLDYSDDSICQEASWFYDSSHLNDKGARIFTNKLIAQIKQSNLF